MNLKEAIDHIRFDGWCGSSRDMDALELLLDAAERWYKTKAALSRFNGPSGYAVKLCLDVQAIAAKRRKR